MGIQIYRLMAGGGQAEVKPLEGEGLQTKVSCQGDIAVQPFYPDENTHGVAWLLLCQGPAGEPGRDINGEVDEGPRMLQDQPGVLIGAEDPRSLDVIIEALAELRRKLWLAKARDIEERLQAGDLTMTEANRLLAERWGVKPEDCYPSEPEPTGLLHATEDIVGKHISEASKGIQDEVGRESHRIIEEVLDPSKPVGKALGDAISRDFDQAIIDGLHEGDQGGVPDEPHRTKTPWGKVTQ